MVVLEKKLGYMQQSGLFIALKFSGKNWSHFVSFALQHGKCNGKELLAREVTPDSLNVWKV